MARIRTIKPSLWGDDKFSRVSREARLLYVGLVSVSDDDGRFLASFSAVCGYVYPNDEDITPAKFRRWFGELVKVGLVTAYEVDGIKYGAHLRFRTHQRISHPQASTLPAPSEVLL